jgi:hypothetical protein
MLTGSPNCSNMCRNRIGPTFSNMFNAMQASVNVMSPKIKQEQDADFNQASSGTRILN